MGGARGSVVHNQDGQLHKCQKPKFSLRGAGHCGQGGRTVARELWAGRPAVGGARASQEKPRISSTSLSSAVGRQGGPISESTSDAALIHGGPCHRALKIISTQD